MDLLAPWLGARYVFIVMRFAQRVGVHVVGAVLATGAPVMAQTAHAVDATLTPGIETSGVVHAAPARFRLTIAEDETVELQVTQPGVDLELRILDADGADPLSVDIRHHTQGDERVIAAIPSGSYVLEIARVTATPTPEPARFTIRSARRSAIATDQRWMDGARAFARAAQQQAPGTGEAFRGALASYEAARDAWTAAGAPLETATAVTRIALMHIMLAQLPSAIANGEAALTLWRSIGDRYGEGKTLSDLAATQFRQGNHARATELYEEAVAIRRTIDDPAGLGYSLMGLAVTRSRVIAGWQDASTVYHEALQLFERGGDRYGQAAALYNLAYACKQRNEFTAAIDYFERSMALRRTLNDLGGQASILTQLAAIHLRLGDAERALALTNDAVALRQRAGDRRGEAYSVMAAGMTLVKLGRPALAAERLQASLALAEAVGDREGQTNALTQLARLRLTTGAPAEALALAERAQTMARGQETFDAAALATVAGDAHLALGDTARAETAYRRSLDVAERLGETLAAADALSGLGRAARSTGNLRASRRHLLEAVERIESVHAGVSQSELRALFSATTHSTYEAAIDTLVALHRQQPAGNYAVEALAMSERRRARVLVELLAEARTDLRAGVERTLIEGEEAVQRRLNARAAARAAAADTDRAAADREISDLVAELRSARAEIRRRAPRYAAVAYPHEIDVPELQRLLDGQTLLLEYALGERGSYLWAVTSTTVVLHRLPERRRIENAVRRARELIAASDRRAVRGPLQQALSELSTMLLGGVAAQLAGQRLAVVADGALQLVPFSALPRPGHDRETPLIVDHEVVMLPSATVLQELRRERDDTHAAKAIAVIADPVLALDDPRFPSNAPRQTAVALTADRTPAFARLPFADDEARAIIAKAHGDGLLALGFDASRELVASPSLRDYRVLHFATHAIVDAVHPELSGIVLTRFDRNGAPVDGVMRLHDIFNLRLGAHTVVLSACETALGANISGEGMMALTRGFMYAGAARLVASLWSVSDRATAALMMAFYAGMFERQLTPAAALRAAQIALWRDPRWRAPLYWSGFTVQGDWQSQPRADIQR